MRESERESEREIEREIDRESVVGESVGGRSRVVGLTTERENRWYSSERDPVARTRAHTRTGYRAT